MAHRMVAANGCATPWTRKFLVSGGASGEVTESASPITYSVVALALGPGAVRVLPAEWWQQADVRIAIAAKDLPFLPGPSGAPEVMFEDTVLWGDKTYRVTGIETFFTPGGGTLPAKPFLYYVGLGT